MLPSASGVHGAWLPPGAQGTDPRHRIDYITVPCGQLSCVTPQSVEVDLDLSLRSDDHFVVSADVHVYPSLPYQHAHTWSRLRVDEA
eukprot:186488-Pyramimonas_sp.AAC.1